MSRRERLTASIAELSDRDIYAETCAALGYIPVRLCWHPRSCERCNRRGEACGMHRVGNPGHETCGRGSRAERFNTTSG